MLQSWGRVRKSGGLVLQTESTRIRGITSTNLSIQGAPKANTRSSHLVFLTDDVNHSPSIAGRWGRGGRQLAESGSMG